MELRVFTTHVHKQRRQAREASTLVRSITNWITVNFVAVKFATSMASFHDLVHSIMKNRMQKVLYKNETDLAERRLS